MATFHCQIKPPRQKSAGKHFDYVECEGRYTNKKDERENHESGNMPEWAKDNPKAFWKAADEFERVNGQTYKEIEVALPRELTAEQRKELVRDFVKSELSNHAYTWDIHNKKASDGQEQPHAHIMFSPRQNDGIERNREQYFKRANSKEPAKGGCKKSDRWAGSLAVQAKNVEKVRERWAITVNRSYEKAAISEKVDHRSLVDQGINRIPEKHRGPVADAMANRFEETRVHTENRSIKALNKSRSIVADLAAAKVQAVAVNQNISRIEASTAEIRGEIERLRQIMTAAQVQPVQVQKSAPLIAKPDVQPVRPFMSGANGQSEALPPVKETNLPPQQPAFQPLTMTGVEIKAVLLGYSRDLDQRERTLEAERKAIPAKAEDIQSSLIYRDVPEWSQWDKQDDVVKGADYKCQQRMALWRQRGEENKWSEEKAPLIFGRDEYKAWKEEGAALKEWRTKIDEGLEKHENRRQELQKRTDSLPNLRTETEGLVNRRQALSRELSDVQDTKREISRAYQSFPKDTEPYKVQGKTGPAIMADKEVLQQIKERKDQERELERSKSRGGRHI